MMNDLREKFVNEIEFRYKSLIDHDLIEDFSLQEISDELGQDDFIKAILSNRLIRRCKYCGKPFVVKNRKRKYCSVECKNTGTQMKRREDPITKEMDHARRIHLYRRSASGKTKAAMKAYEDWLIFAKKAETSCRKGEISIDKFTKIIGTAYMEDWPKR